MKDTNFKNFSYIVIILLLVLVTFGYVAFFTPINKIPIYTDGKNVRYKDR